MPSYFSWLDYSEQDRQRALDVVDLFRETNTRDELGIGTVRDAFSDILFPGSSTIHTRAKYFLFVPWVYLELERKQTPSAQVADSARRLEIALVHALLEAEDTEGVIGSVAKDSLQRLPSSIYWQGLEVWGIRLFAGPQSQYHRSLDTYYRSRRQQVFTDDGDPIRGGTTANWHPGLPDVPPDFPVGATLELTRGEAEYLRERLLTRVGDSLLTYLVDRAEPLEACAFPWMLPEAAALPSHLATELFHGQNFSELIHGAPLLYNLMLAECAEQEERRVHYQQQLADWAEHLQARASAFARWDRDAFWHLAQREGARIPYPTRSFINRWWDLALADPHSVADSVQARDLVRQREHALKKGQARLFSRRALEMWGGAAGTSQLDYRWGSSVQQIITDIIAGLRR